MCDLEEKFIQKDICAVRLANGEAMRTKDEAIAICTENDMKLLEFQNEVDFRIFVRGSCIDALQQ